MKCSTCKHEVSVTWEIGNNKVVCFACLYPHEQLSLERDAMRDDSFGLKTRETLKLAKQN